MSSCGSVFIYHRLSPGTRKISFATGVYKYLVTSAGSFGAQ